jgi:uncharacterized repeat protein (TIGR03987 family)
MELNFAFIAINLALLCYTIGVWSERIKGRLKPWHLVFFWFGITFDTWGTGLMFKMAHGLTFDVHGISGISAIVLMFVHALWASLVLIKKNEDRIRKFHKFSVFVWCVWLIPYFSPMVFHLSR